MLLVSPHFDDAVLSAGQFMADRPDAEVVTVFGGFPVTSERIKTPYDEKCGFKNAQDAVASRIYENDAALSLLEATYINLPFADSQYETELANKTSVDDIASHLQDIINAEDYEFIMAPLGIGHPDHLKTTEAVLSLKTELPIYLWEDLPLRVVEPETVWPRLAMFGLGSTTKLMQPATTHEKMAKKIRALLCYKSQINTGILDPYLMYVPERFWRVK